MRRIRKAFKHLRRAGIDIRFIPELGFDAYAHVRKLAAKDRPLVFVVIVKESSGVALAR